MRIARTPVRHRAEGTVALINVVFLMLIFFLIAGSLAPPLDAVVSLVESRLAEASEPPDALFVTAEGELRARGERVTPESFVGALAEAEGTAAVKLAPDRDLPASRLIDIVAALKEAGAPSIHIVMERARP